MSTVYTDTVKTLSPGQDLTIGTTGQTVTLPGNDLRVNTVKDAGGNTLWTSDGSGNVSSVNAALKGNLVLLSTQTASNSASVSFTTQLTSTYDVYIFKFIEINPATDNSTLEFQCSTDGGSNYNTTMTTTYVQVYHSENDSSSGLGYDTGKDQAQGTAYQKITGVGIGNLADECGVGELHLFTPSSTTYVKQFLGTTQIYKQDNETFECFTSGYFNTTSAIDAINFKMDTGNFDGTVKMYGLL